MRCWKPLIALFLTIVGLTSSPAMGAEPVPQRLEIATRHVPPFAMQRADGSWEGLSIDLWQEISGRLGYAFELRPMGLQEMLAATRDGKVDAAVGALTITSERERQLDFSHPFLSAGLGIAVRRDGTGGWLAVSQRLISTRFLAWMGGLIGLLLLIGVLVWLVERRHNQQFSGGPAAGIGSGFWWSAVTMTTVGYGDKAPQTPIGRGLAVVWMFTSVIIISTFTAGMTTALTVGELSSKIQGPQDLAQARSLTLAGSTSAAFLAANRYDHQALASLPQALEQLADDGADAVVYDAPILRHQVLQSPDNQLRVLPGSFEPQDYGIAFPPGSPLREPVNQQLLELLREPLWQDILYRYLGNRD